MKVLVVTGDIRFGPGNLRFDLQRRQVEELVPVYLGRRTLWPKVPGGHFDVVSVQDPFWRGLYGFILSRRLNARFNVQVHADLSHLSFWRNILARIVLRHADSVRVVSEKIKKQVASMGVSASIHILPVYVEVERFKELSHVPQSQKTILWIGRFEEEKDPLKALDVFIEVRKTTDAKLVMLGVGSLAPLLRAKARGLPVEFPGWQDPLPYLEQADVVISTSKQESYGASIVEALAAGVAVVAPDVGIAREAGAMVVPHNLLPTQVLEVLRKSVRGKLNITLLNEQQYGRLWRETL